jgi:hypothetical protein
VRAVAVASLSLFGLSLFAAAARGPVVVAIHPGADVVPENLLRFYLDFSEPMAGGDAFEHVTLADRNGLIQDAFREIELWSRSGRRLMVYIHPGRIKRGLVFAATMGPVLREGERFTLHVSPGMKSTSGRAMVSPAFKAFAVGHPDREMPDVARWRITPDGVEVDEWLDHAGLEDFVSVDGVRPTRVEGRLLRFTLRAGEHRLAVDPHLEDLTGNNFLRRFETAPDEVERAMTVVERTFWREP